MTNVIDRGSLKATTQSGQSMDSRGGVHAGSPRTEAGIRGSRATQSIRSLAPVRGPRRP